MLNKLRRLKDVRTRFAATGEQGAAGGEEGERKIDYDDV